MPQSKPTITTLKKYLENCSKQELTNDILELFKKYDSIKEYYQLKISPQSETEIIAKYKKAIEDKFFPARGFGKAQLSIAKKAISEYQKVSNSPANIIDIMLFYVEQGVKFTNAYGDIDEPFYNSMESMYEKTIELIVKCQMQDVFRSRCRRIVENTSDIGWGFHDTLGDLYENTFS
jgi:Family of unknown function (DUF6155)